MTKYELFISNFKRVEQNIKKMPGAPAEANFKWLEDNVSSQQIQTKMRMCRLIRNYVQHEPDYQAFIEISDGMLEFLRELNNSVCIHIDGLRSVMTPIGQADYLTSAYTVMYALKKFASGAKSIVYYSASFEEFGVLFREGLDQAILSGVLMSDSMHELEKYVRFGPSVVKSAYHNDAKDIYADDIATGVRIVVKNEEEQVIGIV